MIDQIFFAVSRAVDWEGLAAAHVRAAYRDAAFPVPDGATLAVARSPAITTSTPVSFTAASAGCWSGGLLGNPTITTEMGRAMLRLAQAQLGAGDVDTAEHDAVLELAAR